MAPLCETQAFSLDPRAKIGSKLSIKLGEVRSLEIPRFPGRDPPHEGLALMYFHLLLNKCRCDYRCIFCGMGGTLHIVRMRSEVDALDAVAEWERIQQVLREGGSDPEAEALHIMGNDPSNHPDLVRAVRLARELGFDAIVLETIGLRLEDPAFVAELVEAGVTGFKIPLYGSSPDVHDAIVRLPGAHARVVQVLQNLAEQPVKLEVHALLLKQNLSDLAPLIGRYRVTFRYPFCHENADFDYAHYAPRLSDIPQELLAHSDVDVPCISGRSGSPARVELRMRPEAGGAVDEDPHMRKRRPAKCSSENCRGYAPCRGIYYEYYELFGEDEFKPL